MRAEVGPLRYQNGPASLDMVEVEGLLETWSAVLAATRGVHVLVDPEDGEFYVGSANRWRRPA